MLILTAITAESAVAAIFDTAFFEYGFKKLSLAFYKVYKLYIVEIRRKERAVRGKKMD